MEVRRSAPLQSAQIEQLGEKLAELEEERAELHKYQQEDRQRRALEFTIYDADLSDIRTQLEQVRRHSPRQL